MQGRKGRSRQHTKHISFRFAFSLRFIILSNLDSKVVHCTYVRWFLLICPAHTQSDSTTQIYKSLFALWKSWYRTHSYSKDSGKNRARRHLARTGGLASRGPLSLDQGYRSLETRSRTPDHFQMDYHGPWRRLLNLLSCFLWRLWQRHCTWDQVLRQFQTPPWFLCSRSGWSRFQRGRDKHTLGWSCWWPAEKE